tara:strand:- start:7 stop:345 length:339 start_codon:yes stop_codon:yes gene_type:complete
MTTLDEAKRLNGEVLEEFVSQVTDYLKLRDKESQAKKNLEEAKKVLKEHLQDEGLSEITIGDHVVRLLDMKKETVDADMAKILIPKKYLADALKTTEYQQLRVDKKKDEKDE